MRCRGCGRLGADVPLTQTLRAVFDTNVVVSALVFGRRLAWLRNGWASGTLVPVVCRQTTEELLRVLAYPKFRLAPEDRMALLQDFLPYADIATLPETPADLSLVIRDRDDAVFLRLAMEAKVPLITGDRDITSLRSGGAPVQILSLAELGKMLA